VNSSLGAVVRTFSIRVGAPSGTQAPVTYTRTLPTPLAFPDNRPIGVEDSLTITDDFEIDDLDVRIDSVTHTFPGDLTFGIKGPNGYGTDVLSFLGGAVAGGGDGDNMANTLFTDEGTSEVLLQPNAAAPYTGSFRPVFNSPVWITLGFPAPEVNQLGNFDGSSTQGTWIARIADQAAIDTGTLNAWSLIVTPRAFACTPFVPTATTVSISGRVLTTTGRGLAATAVALTDAQGNTRTVHTNAFGFYQFTEVPVLGTYVVRVISRRFQFNPQVVTPQDNITGLNFVATGP
jgi:subtilisin-like proprotein convertase family protein